MKTIQNAFRMLLCSLLLSVCVLLGFGSAEAAERIGAFSKVEGQVDVMRGGALPAVAAKAGDPVHVGDFIRTKTNARAEVTFSDGNLLKIAQRSRIDISEYLAAGSGDSRKFNLPRGKVQAVVTKGSPTGKTANRFEIHTPNAVAGVRGTEFFVFHDRNVTGILVKEGSVYAFNPKVPKNVVTIPAGTVTTVSEKGAPQSPRPASDAEKRNMEKETTVSPKSGTAADSGTTEQSPATAASATPTTQSESATASEASGTAAGTDTAPVVEASTDAAPAELTAEPVGQQPTTETPTSATDSTSALPVSEPVIALSPLAGDAVLQPTAEPIIKPVIETPPPEPPVVIVPPTETFPEQTLNPVNFTLTATPVQFSNSATATFGMSDATLTYTYSLDNGASLPFSGSISGLSDGSHTVSIVGQDASGSVSQPVTFSWTVDTVNPIATLVSYPGATNTSTTPTFAVQSNEPGNIEYQVDSGAWVGLPSNGTIPALTEGSHSINFRTTDLAGNTSSPASTNLFVGSRTIHFGGTMSGMPGGGVLGLPGRLFEYADKSAGSWGFLTTGSGTPSAALNIAAGGTGALDGTTLDGYWQISSTATASGGVISGGLYYTYLGFDRLVSNSSGSISGSYDANGWSLSAGGTATTGYASPLGFAAEIKTGSMHRDSTIDTNSNLLTIIGHGAIDGLLGAPAGLWSATSVPFTLLGVYQGPDTSNSYWQGNIHSHKYSTVGLASPDGATFSGFVGGANIDTAGTTAGNLSALYVAPRSGGGFGAGIINGSFSGSLGSGFWGGSGTMERFELNSSIAVDPATMPDDWWTTNTFTASPPVATGPVPTNQDNNINAEGFLLDGSLNMTSELENRGDVLRLTAFAPDPTFGVWQRESFGSFTGSNSDVVLITNTADGAVVNGKLVPDNIFNIVSLGGWGTSGEISGRAYGLWGDWRVGETRLLSGVVNGSYNAGLGTFGAITTGAWLDVNRFLGLTSAERQQAGFPGLQEFSFNLSGNNGLGGSVALNNIRTFSHAAGDPLSLWATDDVTGTFSGTVPEGEQIAVSDGSGQIRGSFRLEHGGTSGGSDVWLAEINGLGEATGPFRSSFNGVAAGTWSGSTFTGTAAGITHPITYYSSFGSTNLLKRYDGASGYQFAGALHGVFGGMSLWTATDLLPSDFEIAGVHTPSALPSQDYIFTTEIDSFDIPAGSATTVDGGAYSGYLVGSFATGFTYPEEPIDGRVATLYAAPDGTAGILAGKFDGYVDLSGVWESRGDWFPVEIVSTPGSVSPTSWTLLSSSLPLNVAQAGSFIGAGGGSISTVASISGNALDRTWISSLPWGVWRLTTSGTYTGPTYNDWQYGMHADDGSFAFTAEILGDRWETAPPPPATPFVGKLHGIVGGSWVDMTPTVPATGILIGETVGTFDPNASRWQAVAAGAFMETNAFLQMASTAAGQAKLQQLNIPAFEIGAADFSGSGTNGTDSISVAMNGVKFFAPTAGGRPVIWATGTVSGTYAGNPVAVSNVTLSGSSATVSGLAPNFTVQNWGSNKWQASITDTSGAGTVGGHTSIQIKGMGAGSYTGTGSGTLSGTANGSVR